VSLLLLLKTASVTVCNTTSPSGNVLVVTGLTETLLPGCSLSLGAGYPSIGASWDIWISQNRPTVYKTATLRLRRTNITGAILASIDLVPYTDNTDGHRDNSVNTFTDSAPTDGTYVFTVQQTAGDAFTEIWSDTRTFCIEAPSPYASTLRATQEVIESVHIANPFLRKSQLAVESVQRANPFLIDSQLAIESTQGANPFLITSQVVIELVFKTGVARNWAFTQIIE